MKQQQWFLLCLVFLLAMCRTVPTFAPEYRLDRFEEIVKGYEARDLAAPPAPGGIAFGGSSSIYFWETLEQDFAPKAVKNYGFGGSTFPEVEFYAERTLLKHQPSKIVIYCENDLFESLTKTPAQVGDAYIRLVKKIRRALPTVEVWCLSLKPSPLRWARWEEVQEVNRLLKAAAKGDSRHYFVDVAPIMMKGGRPDPAIFLADSLHMNEEGYRRWTALLKPMM